jgi:type II secretory pathway component GspD/PulD (secretin)
VSTTLGNATVRRVRWRSLNGGWALMMSCLAGLLSVAGVQAQDLKIIELEHRLAEQVLPSVEPLVEPGGAITGADNVLFVRSSESNFEQIRQAVAMLDRAPRELLISVGQGTVRDFDAAGGRVEATIGSGSAQVGINRPPNDGSGIQVQAAARRQHAELQNVSTVRTLEGQETLLSSGQSVPVSTTEVLPGPYGSVRRQTTTLRDLSTGFYATARTSGDRVTIDISARQQNVVGPDVAVHTRGVNTSVSGRLGEWIELGSVSDSASGGTGGLFSGRMESRDTGYATWVKVEAIH